MANVKKIIEQHKGNIFVESTLSVGTTFIISLDYSLPGKINGMDLYHYIRKTDKSIPILFISGNIEFIESIPSLKNQDPFIGHLSKPYFNKDYVKWVNRLLSKGFADDTFA